MASRLRIERPAERVQVGAVPVSTPKLSGAGLRTVRTSTAARTSSRPAPPVVTSRPTGTAPSSSIAFTSAGAKAGKRPRTSAAAPET